MASRWLAMICACQTRATDIMLSETTQSMRTRVTLDSWTGRAKARRSQDMVRYLLALSSRSPPYPHELELATPEASRLPDNLMAIEGPSPGARAQPRIS